MMQIANMHEPCEEDCVFQIAWTEAAERLTVQRHQHVRERVARLLRHDPAPCTDADQMLRASQWAGAEEQGSEARQSDAVHRGTRTIRGG